MDIFRINPAAFFHHHPGFLIEAGKFHDRGNHVVFDCCAINMLKQGVATLKKVFDQHSGLAGGHLMIKYRRKSRGRIIDDHHRFGVTMADASDGRDAGVKTALGNSLLKGQLGIQCTGGNAAGRRTDQNFWGRI